VLEQEAAPPVIDSLTIEDIVHLLLGQPELVTKEGKQKEEEYVDELACQVDKGVTLIYPTDTHAQHGHLIALCRPPHTYAISDIPPPTRECSNIAGLWIENEDDMWDADPNNWIYTQHDIWVKLGHPPPPFVQRPKRQRSGVIHQGRPDCKEFSGCHMCKGV
jgi:hypothetical protein